MLNQIIKKLPIWIALPALISGCAMQAASVRTEAHAARKVAIYQDLLGKSVLDQFVGDFLVRNQCSSAHQVWLCREGGLALRLGSNQEVETVYLYVNNSEGFIPYKGELPLGLKFYDTMGAVEYKLNLQELGNDGRPDSGATPDHMHYHAVYRQAGIMVIYNSPSVDEDATIYAVLVHDRGGKIWQP
jgi:hypothetical protein